METIFPVSVSRTSCECETTPSGETSKATITLEGILLTMAFPPSGRVAASTSPMFIFPARAAAMP